MLNDSTYGSINPNQHAGFLHISIWKLVFTFQFSLSEKKNTTPLVEQFLAPHPFPLVLYCKVICLHAQLPHQLTYQLSAVGSHSILLFIPHCNAILLHTLYQPSIFQTRIVITLYNSFLSFRS